MKMLLSFLLLIVVVAGLAACRDGGPEPTVVLVTAAATGPVVQETPVVVGKADSTSGPGVEETSVTVGLATPAPEWEAAGTVVLAGTLRPVVESVPGPSEAGPERTAVGSAVGSPASAMFSKVVGSVAVEDVLADSAAAMEQVGSAHYEASMVSTAMENGQSVDLVVTLSGDVERPDREHVTIGFEISGVLAVEAEAIVIGSDFYVKDSVTGVWEVDADTIDVGVSFLELSEVGFDLIGVPEVEISMEVDLEGREMYRVAGPVDGLLLDEVLRDPELEVGSGEVRYWIGVEDLLVYRVEFVMDEAGWMGVLTGLEMVVEFSGYGEDFDIRAPVLGGQDSG